MGYCLATCYFYASSTGIYVGPEVRQHGAQRRQGPSELAQVPRSVFQILQSSLLL